MFARTCMSNYLVDRAEWKIPDERIDVDIYCFESEQEFPKSGDIRAKWILRLRRVLISRLSSSFLAAGRRYKEIAGKWTVQRSCNHSGEIEGVWNCQRRIQIETSRMEEAGKNNVARKETAWHRDTECLICQNGFIWIRVDDDLLIENLKKESCLHLIE